MNYHIISGHSFIPVFHKNIEKLEKCNNKYICSLSVSDKIAEIVGEENVIKVMDVSIDNSHILEGLIQEGDKIFIHYLAHFAISFVYNFKNTHENKIYWIYFGGDLYPKIPGYKVPQKYAPAFSLKSKVKSFLLRIIHLGEKYPRYKAVLNKIDYFCFWNEYDFKILLDNFNTKASFKYFRYGNITDSLWNFEKPYKNIDGNVLLNHSAGINSNHEELLNILENMDNSKSIKNIYVPMAYGNQDYKEDFRRRVESSNLRGVINIQEEHLPIDQYLNILNHCCTAIFGHKRQQAAGNIFYLLGVGVKVIIQKDTSFYKYLKERGYFFDDIDNFINSAKNYSFSLTEEQKEKNRMLVLEEYSKDAISMGYQNLMN